MNIKNIYPEIVQRTDGEWERLETVVRRKWKGKWYLQLYRQSTHAGGKTRFIVDGLIMVSLCNLIREIEKQRILGNIMPNAKTVNGELLFELDPDQDSEHLRLLKIEMRNGWIKKGYNPGRLEGLTKKEKNEINKFLENGN